jgi:hypothetical protein
MYLFDAHNSLIFQYVNCSFCVFCVPSEIQSQFHRGAFLLALWNAKPIPLGRLYESCLSCESCLHCIPTRVKKP